MTILEYIEFCRNNKCSDIPKSKHPVFHKYHTQNTHSRYWSIQEAISWFDSTFPLDTAISLLSIIHKQKKDSPEELDSLLKDFNKFSIRKVNKHDLFRESNCFVYNSIWSSTPKAVVTCRYCGTTTDSTLGRYKLFKKDKGNVLGVSTECKKCVSELTLSRMQGTKLIIKGPYSLLSDSKRCLGCNKVVSKDDLVFTFRRTRWTSTANHKHSKLEATVPYMFSKYCLECEKGKHKPGPQIKQGDYNLYSRC